jgi:hypothetical protein
MFTGGFCMKKTTMRIIQAFPNLRAEIAAKTHTGLEESENFDPVQHTFLKLACFFENPEETDFNLGYLYKTLDNDWLEWALELITQFFREETYLIQNPSFAIVKDGAGYLNQSQFAEYLTAQGLRYDRAKVKNYYDRGKIPAPDLLIAGTKYWRQTTANEYAEKMKSTHATSIKKKRDQ